VSEIHRSDSDRSSWSQFSYNGAVGSNHRQPMISFRGSLGQILEASQVVGGGPPDCLRISGWSPMLAMQLQYVDGLDSKNPRRNQSRAFAKKPVTGACQFPAESSERDGEADHQIPSSQHISVIMHDSTGCA
jgi:hypothetical protein